MSVRILQLNCQSAYAVTAELGAWMSECGAEIALLQEPYSAYGHVRGIPASMRVFVNGRANAAIVINDRRLECLLVTEFTNEWGVCVWIKGTFGEMLLISMYCKFGEAIGPYLGYLDAALRKLSGKPVVLGMDANASSPLWFGGREGQTSRANARGEELCELFLANSMHVLNERSEFFTFDGPMGVSNIDVTAVNGAALRFDFHWRIDPEFVSSDHRLIEVTMTFVMSGTIPVCMNERKWIDAGADWNLYVERFREVSYGISLNDFRSMSIDHKVETIDGWMVDVNETMFKRPSQALVKKTSWWNSALNEKRKAVRRLRRIFQAARAKNRSDMEECGLNFRCALREYNRMIVKAKEENWKQFMNDNKDDPWGNVYRICRGKRATEISGVRVGNEVTRTWNESVQALLDSFFPVGEPLNLSAESEPSPSLDTDEVDRCVSIVRLRKSPGHDGMSGGMCKAIWRAIPEFVECLLGECLSKGYFPRQWKKARVTVLLKGPDKPRDDPRSYRGICLLPVLGKVLERIMVRRVESLAVVAASRWQFGFKPGLCTEDAWMNVINSVNESSAKYVLGIFVDFKGAFDHLEWRAIVERLSEIGCRELALWMSYFSDRCAYVRGVNECVERVVTRGTPQGSVSGPFIWNLMMDVLLARLEGLCKFSAYADDLVVMIEGESRSELERKGLLIMNVINEWGQSVGVEVSSSKTEMMLLKGILRGRYPTIRMNERALRYSKQVRYLGVTMNERMSFLVHVNVLKRKILSVLGPLRRVLKCEWGLSKRAVSIIYKGLFLACATYAASVWCGVALRAVGRARLLSCQRLWMYACLPVCRTVSTDAMQVLLGVAPLDLEVVRVANAFRVRKGLPLADLGWLSNDAVAGKSTKECMGMLYDCMIERWQERWVNAENGRVTFRFIKNVSFMIENPEFNMGLMDGFFITGHGSFNSFLYDRGLSDSCECFCGALREDWQHVLCECPLYRDIRNLNTMGVVFTNDEFDGCGVVENSECYEALKVFAREVFDRRMRFVSAT